VDLVSWSRPSAPDSANKPTCESASAGSLLHKVVCSAEQVAVPRLGLIVAQSFGDSRTPKAPKARPNDTDMLRRRFFSTPRVRKVQKLHGKKRSRLKNFRIVFFLHCANQKKKNKMYRRPLPVMCETQSQSRPFLSH
jgi:hypothetical protein